MCFPTRKQCKSCGAYVSCVFQQGSSVKVVVPMHHAFANERKEFKSRAIYASCFSTRKEFKSCGFYASCFYQQERS